LPSSDNRIGSSPPSPPGLSRAESRWLGVRRATPLALSSGMFGILYGASCASLGISPEMAALSCLLVFSGAAQFAALGMLAEPVSYSAIAVSGLLICNRLALMGASIADHVRDRPLYRRIVGMTVLTDGAWAATVAENKPVDRFAFFIAAGLWILTLWTGGALVGALAATDLPLDAIQALRFAGVLFLALLLLLVVRNTAMGHLPWAAAALASFAASQALPLPAAFLAGVAAGAVVAWRGQAKGCGDAD